jgi:hypothetical protein
LNTFKFVVDGQSTLVYTATEQSNGKTVVSWKVGRSDDSLSYDTEYVQDRIAKGNWIVTEQLTPVEPAQPTISDRIKAFTKGTDFAVLFARDRYEVIAFSKVFVAETDEELLELFGKIEDLATWSKA